MISPPNRKSNKPLRETELISEGEKKYVDAYTLRMRRRPGDTNPELPLRKRIIRTVEGVNRKVWYSLLGLLFDAKTISSRVKIEDLKSVFIVPIGDAIGDAIIMLPIMAAIKRRNPACRIGTFDSERSKTLLRNNPHLDARYHFRGKSALRNIRSILNARRDGYQVVINMHFSGRTEAGIMCNVISPHGAKVCNMHPRHEMYRLLFSKMVPFDRGSMHLAQFALVMLESVVDMSRPIEQWETRPAIPVVEEVNQTVTERIESTLHKLGASWYIYFNTEARNPQMEWGFENTIAFAKQFMAHYPEAAILFSGSPVRASEIRRSIASSGLERCELFPTSYDLLEVAVLTRRAKLVITPDTSIIHFGTAEDRPTLVLWSKPSKLPIEWIPLQVPSYNLAPKVDGLPVSSIPLEDVWSAAVRLLEGSWISSATTIGLDPESDILYQASQTPLNELIELSEIPIHFTEGNELKSEIKTELSQRDLDGGGRD